MAMFPQFFTYPSLYSRFFRSDSNTNPSTPPSPNAFATQLAFFNNAAFQHHQQQQANSAYQQQQPTINPTQFLVDNFLRERAAAAAAAAFVAAAANQENVQHELLNGKCSPSEILSTTKCVQEQSNCSRQASPQASEATDHETESCDRNSDSNSPNNINHQIQPSPVTNNNKASALKFGVNAILSNDPKETTSNKSQHHLTKSLNLKGRSISQ